MEGLALQVDYWHWLVLGVLLIIVEVFAPGTFFLWLGTSAGVIALLLWLMPDLSLEVQLLWFAVLSVLTVLIMRRYQKSHPTRTDQPHLNRRGEQYVGRTFTLPEPINNGQGKIRVDDTTWKVTGEDCAAGTRVTVTGADGVVLQVTPAPD